MAWKLDMSDATNVKQVSVLTQLEPNNSDSFHPQPVFRLRGWEEGRV
jgi:hypothetical protein